MLSALEGEGDVVVNDLADQVAKRGISAAQRVRERDANGTVLACLSAKGDARWRPRAAHLDRITLHAAITRTARDSGEEWRPRLRCDTWEIPVVEAWWWTGGRRATSAHRPMGEE